MSEDLLSARIAFFEGICVGFFECPFEMQIQCMRLKKQLCSLLVPNQQKPHIGIQTFLGEIFVK